MNRLSMKTCENQLLTPTHITAHRARIASRGAWRVVMICLAAAAAPLTRGEDLPQRNWLATKAYVVPKETAPEGEGYFALIEGKNGRLYVGTHANGVNSWLVEFDPAAEKMQVVVDAHKAIGMDLRGMASQAKIHSRNNVGPSGKVYFGTKQGYPTDGEKPSDYPGGYPMVYDPATGQTKVYSIPVEHQGVISVTPDESRNLAYISTCSDERPIESSHFLVLDLLSGKYTDLIDSRHMYAFIVVDFAGRAYHPMLGGDILRYDPDAKRLDRLKQTINGNPPTSASNLAHSESHPINWDISPDGKTLYAVAMSTNELFAYDLAGAAGDTLAGKSLGPLIKGAMATDCRAMCVGPTGVVWCSVTETGTPEQISLHHLVRYAPGEAEPVDLGPVSVSNPNFTEFVDTAGQPLPYHHGFTTFPNGVTTSKYVTMGVCEARDGAVYTMVLAPLTILKWTPPTSGK